MQGTLSGGAPLKLAHSDECRLRLLSHLFPHGLVSRCQFLYGGDVVHEDNTFINNSLILQDNRGFSLFFG